MAPASRTASYCRRTSARSAASATDSSLARRIISACSIKSSRWREERRVGHHLRRARRAGGSSPPASPAGLADLVERALDSRSKLDGGGDHADVAVAVAVHARRLPAVGDLAQPVAQPVDAGERGEGVVDRRGERPNGDLDELVDREGEILRQRPVRPGDVRARRALGPRRAPRRRATRWASGSPSTTKWPGRCSSRITASAARGDADQRARGARTAGSRCWARALAAALLVQAQQQLAPARVPPSARRPRWRRPRRRSRGRGRRRCWRSPAAAGSSVAMWWMK